MKKILSTILTLTACTTLTAQDFKITHGPWLCDLTSDGVTVVWATSKPALSWVEVAEDDGRSFYAAEHERRYENRGRAQAGPQDAAQHPPERASARHEIPLPHLLAGGARVEIQRQGLLRRHRGIERLLAPAVRVQHPPHVGMRPLVRRSERHPRAGRLHGRALPPDRLRTDRLRGLQRRHVEQHRKSRTALPRLHRRLGRGFRLRDADPLQPRQPRDARHLRRPPAGVLSQGRGQLLQASTWPAR